MKPELRTPFPPDESVWVCPITGIRVPKGIEANLKWRREMLAKAEHDAEFRSALYSAGKQSVLLWVNLFVWTFRLFYTDPDGTVRQCSSSEAHVPYITWEIQDRHIKEIEQAIDEGYDFLTDKARDMGATWNHLVVIAHKWIYENDRSFLLISRKEDCVDSPGRKSLMNPADPGTLFGKLDYLMMWLPDWMRPPYQRTTLHMINPVNHSRIDGESSNESAGSSDRRTAILLDEMAKMAEGDSIKRSTRDVTACRLANSTPDGAGTAFSKWRFSGTVKVFSLPWWEHPEKGRSRYVVQDETTEMWAIRSPWYDREAKIRTPQELASEVNMDHIGSGQVFFEADILARYRAAYVKRPIGISRMIEFKKDIPQTEIPQILARNKIDSVQCRCYAGAPWRFWVHLVNGRPDQTKNYVFGIDISKGMGASNSVISAVCVETREKVAEWACATVSPPDFARIAAASALWFGGSQRGNRPFLIWESNGDPGIYFGKMLIQDLLYPSYYMDRHAPGQLHLKRSKKYGWHSNPIKKAEVLGDLHRAYMQGTFTNPSAESIDEAGTYIRIGQQIVPAVLQTESESARATHGDRVIADALALYGLNFVKVNKSVEMKAPMNSFAERYQKWQQAQKDSKKRRKWDLRYASVG